MGQDTPIDVAEMLTEVGVDADTADPAVSVGDSSILRSERTFEGLALHTPPTARVTLESKIGEGEITEVYLGTQTSMRRPVAIRSVHPHRRTANAPGYVLSEAWMLGAFEHPNILPVYDVTKNDEGLPLVIMKAIETVPWTEVLETPGHKLGCPRHADPLVFNVKRLIMVCEALEHAHFRGTIHRDVKPDNVLIGRDGTVYLHGWDLAVALEEDPTGRFPPAREQTQIAGTPAYMAPELATRDAARLSPATDVYLVGATLHEIVTGEPRHTGENVFDAFHSAATSLPIDYGEDVPLELAVIMNRAMAVEPADRFASMTELRHALEAFLRHRPSHQLTQHAVQAHQEFSRSVAAGAEDYIIRELFATAYTAYGMARTFWSRNPVVAKNLEGILREMIVYETEHGSGERARDLLARLNDPDPELERLIEASEEFPTIPRGGKLPLADTNTRTQKIFGPADEPVETPAQRQDRRMLMLSTVIIWSTFGFAFAAVDAWTDVEVTNQLLGVVALIAWLALSAIAWVKARTATPTAIRNVLGPMGAVVAGSAGLIITMGTTATPEELVIAHLMLFFVAIAMLNAWFDWRLIVASGAYLLAFIIGSFVPSMAFILMGVSNLIGLGFAGYIIDHRLRGAPS